MCLFVCVCVFDHSVGFRPHRYLGSCIYPSSSFTPAGHLAALICDCKALHFISFVIFFIGFIYVLKNLGELKEAIECGQVLNAHFHITV